METVCFCCIMYGEREKQEIHSPDALYCWFSFSSFRALILPGSLSFHFLEIHITPLLMRRTWPAPPLRVSSGHLDHHSLISLFIFGGTMPACEGCWSCSSWEWLWMVLTRFVLFCLDTVINNLIPHCLLFSLQLLIVFMFLWGCSKRHKTNLSVTNTLWRQLGSETDVETQCLKQSSSGGWW